MVAAHFSPVAGSRSGTIAEFTATEMLLFAGFKGQPRRQHTNKVATWCRENKFEFIKHAKRWRVYLIREQSEIGDVITPMSSDHPYHNDMVDSQAEKQQEKKRQFRAMGIDA